MPNILIITYPACQHSIPAQSYSEREVLKEIEKAANEQVCPKCRASQAASALRAIPSESRTEASRQNMAKAREALVGKDRRQSEETKAKKRLAQQARRERERKEKQQDN